MKDKFKSFDGTNDHFSEDGQTEIMETTKEILEQAFNAGYQKCNSEHIFMPDRPDFEEWYKTNVQSKAVNFPILDVSQRTFTPTCIEVENMAVEIDQFINQHALAKPMTYSKKLRQYLAAKLNEYGG